MLDMLGIVKSVIGQSQGITVTFTHDSTTGGSYDIRAVFSQPVRSRGALLSITNGRHGIVSTDDFITWTFSVTPTDPTMDTVIRLAPNAGLTNADGGTITVTGNELTITGGGSGSTPDPMTPTSPHTGAFVRVGTLSVPDAPLTSIGNTLYTVSNGALATIDPSTGVVTRIGNAFEFGLGSLGPPRVHGETFAAGLASIGSNLYMIGGNKRFLYRVNTSTGIATAVTSRLSSLGRIAALGNTLYILLSDGLYTVNITTGAFTRVGLSNFGLLDTTRIAPRAFAAQGSFLYGIFRITPAFGAGYYALYVIDTTTAELTRVGNVNLFKASGLASLGGLLYATDSDGRFYRSADSSITASFSLGTQSVHANGYLVHVRFSKTVFNVGLDDFSVTNGSLSNFVNPRNAQDYRFRVIPTDPNVDVVIDIADTASITDAFGGTVTVDHHPFRIESQSITAVFGNTVFDFESGTARTPVTFSASIFPGSFVTSDITRSGTAGVDYTIRRVDGTTLSARRFELNWTLPRGIGSQTFDITGAVQRTDRTQVGVVVDAETFNFNNRLPANAALTPPASPIKTLMFAVDCRFDQVVGGFAVADVSLTGDNTADLTLNSITAKPGGDAGRDYFLNFSVDVDKVGSASIAITGTVTVGSQQVPVVVGSNRMVWDTRQAINATFGTAAVNSIARTVTVRATFERAIDVSSFTASDMQIGTNPSVSTSVAITQVNSGTTDDEFDIVISLPEDSTGTASYDISGKVTESDVSRDVLVSEGSVEYTTFPSTISPTMRDHEGTKTGNFSVRVNFLNTGVSGFDSDDVSISLMGVSASVVSLGAGLYRIDFSGLPDDSNGTFTLDLIGSVQISMEGSRSITFAPVTITYDTRTPITARWDASSDPYTADAISFNLLFDTDQIVSGLTAADFTITRISGDTLAAANLTALGIIVPFGITVAGTEYEYFLSFTEVPTGVSGVISLSLTGRVTVSGVEKTVSIPNLQIRYDRTGSAPATGAALVVISPPERPVGFLADIPISQPVTFDIRWDRAVGDRRTAPQNFSNADVRIHESTSGSPRNPTASDLVPDGTFDPFTHFRLTYTPPANSQGEVYIEVVEDALPDVNSLPAYSPIIEFDTRPTVIPPVPIWEVPDGVQTAVFVGQEQTKTFDVDVNFGEMIRGLTVGNFVIEGIANETTVLYRVVGGREILHTDNTPASLFRLKIRPHGNQRGIMGITLLRESVTAVDDTALGPVVNSQSPPILYDTTPEVVPRIPPTPTWQNVPDMITEANSDIDIDLNFGENITGLIGNDIVEDGVANRRITLYKVVNGVESLHTDDTPASLFRVKIQINARQRGTLTLTLKKNSVVSEDDSTSGPVLDVSTPGIYYDTFSETTPEVAPPRVTIGLAERPVGRLAGQPISHPVTFDMTWDRDVGTEFTHADIAIHESTSAGATNPLAAALENVGTTGTTTHFRLTYTPPTNAEGAVAIFIRQGAVGESAPAMSLPVLFNTTPDAVAATPTPDIVSVEMPEGIQSDPFDAVVVFDRAVTGVTTAAFMIDPEEVATITSVTATLDDMGDVVPNSYTIRITPVANTPLSLVTLRLRGGIVDIAE